MVIFAQQNIIMDPPFTKLDLLSCRNLLIYFGPELQKKLIPLISLCLDRSRHSDCWGIPRPSATLTTLFARLDSQSRLYRRIEQTVIAGRPSIFPPSIFRGTNEPSRNRNGQNPA